MVRVADEASATTREARVLPETHQTDPGDHGRLSRNHAVEGKK
jgi:hypothetical protein